MGALTLPGRMDGDEDYIQFFHSMTSHLKLQDSAKLLNWFQPKPKPLFLKSTISYTWGSSHYKQGSLIFQNLFSICSEFFLYCQTLLGLKKQNMNPFGTMFYSRAWRFQSNSVPHCTTYYTVTEQSPCPKDHPAEIGKTIRNRHRKHNKWVRRGNISKVQNCLATLHLQKYPVTTYSALPCFHVSPQ